jgi:hypothetical protein
MTILKGHAALWWNELQDEKIFKGKSKIKIWYKTVAKLKGKFIPKVYQVNLFIRIQNLRQKGLSVREYTEEFYKLNIRVGHKYNDDEKFARYINGMRYEI